MICKSNNNSYHDGTSAFFNVFSEKDPELNAVERGFELLTSEFELVNCKFELVTHGFKFATRGFELVTPEFELVDLNS